MEEYIEVNALDELYEKVDLLGKAVIDNKNKVNMLEYELDKQIKQTNIAFFLVFLCTLLTSIQIYL